MFCLGLVSIKYFTPKSVLLCLVSFLLQTLPGVVTVFVQFTLMTASRKTSCSTSRTTGRFHLSVL